MTRSDILVCLTSGKRVVGSMAILVTRAVVKLSALSSTVSISLTKLLDFERNAANGFYTYATHEDLFTSVLIITTSHTHIHYTRAPSKQ